MHQQVREDQDTNYDWWRLSNKEIAADSAALEQRQLAYYATFYANESGRAVLHDIMRLCYDLCGGLNTITRDNAIAVVALIHLYQVIRARCGIADEKAVIDAEAKTIVKPFESSERS